LKKRRGWEGGAGTKEDGEDRIGRRKGVEIKSGLVDILFSW